MAYEIEQHEVDALLTNLLGDLLAEPDDLIAYEALTREQALYDALVSAIKRERGKRLASLEKAVHSMAEAKGQRIGTLAARERVAELASLGSRQRVEQLIRAAAA